MTYVINQNDWQEQAFKKLVCFPHPFFFHVSVNGAYLCLSKLNPSTCAPDSRLCHTHRDLILPVMVILLCIQALDSNCFPHIPPFLQCYSSLVSDFTTRLNLPQISNTKAFRTSPPVASSMGLSPSSFLFYAFLKCYCLPFLFLVLSLVYIFS